MTDLSDLKTIEVFDLEQLLSPYSVSEFLTSHWPEAFLYLEGNGKRLAAPLSIRELTDVENLARVCKRDVILWPPKNGNTSLHEHVADQSCPPNLALGFYDAGVTLYFTQVESYVLPIRQMLRSIENDLRLSPGTMECEIFASRKGSGTPVHFDHEINFNIQLKGKKRWTIAKNTSAPSPLTHFKIYDTPMGDLASYWEGPVLNEIPSNSRSFLAEEGSLVFLPQGYWHSTVCETDSLALSFVAKPPSWASIVIKLIRAELIKDERWRKRSMIQK
ncbi:MAG: hypothetical protein KDD48_06560, partial [Bdellovibrionales bacterium]|nr:hypothetical protein [Bdellovibrionales bacterium]